MTASTAGAVAGSAAPHDAAPRAATATAVTAWGLGALSLVLLLGARPQLTEGLLFYLVDLAVALVLGTVAALVLSRRSHVVAWLLAVTAVGGGLAATGYAYGALATRLGGLPAVDVVAGLSRTAWLPGTFALFLVVPWLVRDGRPLPPSGTARAGLVVGAALTVALTAVALTPRLALVFPLQATLTGLAVLVGLWAAADCLLRRREVPAGEAAGYGWLALGTAVIALSFVPVAVPSLFEVLPVAVVPALHLLSQAVYPAAVLVVVLRRRLWGLDLAVSRAVLAGALSLLLVGTYIVVTAVVAAVVPGAGVAQVVAAAVVVVAVQPSRVWLQHRVERLVYGAGADPVEAVRRMGSQLGAAATTEDLLGGLADAVRSALRLDGVVLVVGGEEVVRRGVVGGETIGVPLEHRGAPVGRLVVSAPGGERLDARSRAALADLAGVVAAGVALTVAARELEDARGRITAARAAERRRIRRAVHDGLGPSLAGLRLGLEAARNLVRTDPAAAADVLDALQEEVQARVEDVRTLARDLLPPVLDELGLAAALEDLAARHAASGFRVELDVVPGTGPPAELAAAAYGIAAEAVSNAARHSGASSCSVHVRRDGERLVLRVVDDGAGIAPGTPGGVGTWSMRERADEVRASLHVGPAPGGGTVVEAVLPWRG